MGTIRKRKKKNIDERKKSLTIGNLEWSDRSKDHMNWNAAKQYCKNLTEKDRSDWRLPTISELKKTIKNCQSGSSLCKVSDSCLSASCWLHNGEHNCLCEYRKNSRGYYSKLGDSNGVWLWSSSTLSDSTGDSAWYVDFNYGDVDFSNKTDNGIFVRCVR